MEVAVFVVDEVADFGLAAIGEVLSTANALRTELANPPPPWRLTTLGATAQVRTGAGHLVTVTPVEAATTRPDLLIVPAANVKDAAELTATVRSPRHAPALAMIADAHDRGVRLAAACTGTFFLAEAGVLDGGRATTSWWLGPTFRERYPRVQLDESRLLCHTATATTAGAALAHIDLALALVQSRSPALAELVARFLLIGARTSQAGFAIPEVLARTDPATAAFERWVREHIDEPLTVSRAARALGLSERHLQRTTAATLGMSPLDFITEIRLEHATQLLRTTTLSAEAIARAVGYLSANTLRALIRRRRHLTLREVREGPVVTTRSAPETDPVRARDPGAPPAPAHHTPVNDRCPRTVGAAAHRCRSTSTTT